MNYRILDIHTHKYPPQRDAIINIRLPHRDMPIEPLRRHQLYSVGFHPWDTYEDSAMEDWDRFEALASLPNVVAIGECGIDMVNCHQALFRQMLVFKRQIELSESLGKAMIIHAVKADSIICGLRRDMKPQMPWVIHGFRGKPAAAAMLVRSGCFLSFGKNFNPNTVTSVPLDRILAETDECGLPIKKIIDRLASVRKEGKREFTKAIVTNSEIFCNFDGSTNL